MRSKHRFSKYIITLYLCRITPVFRENPLHGSVCVFED